MNDGKKFKYFMIFEYEKRMKTHNLMSAYVGILDVYQVGTDKIFISVHKTAISLKCGEGWQPKWKPEVLNQQTHYEFVPQLRWFK